MSVTWDSGERPCYPKITRMGWVRVVLRGIAVGFLIVGGLLLLLLIRLVERPIWGLERPITPWITKFICRNVLRVIGLRHAVEGVPMKGRGAAVANHSSWLDIFSLNAAECLYFVSKSEVAGWPGIGWLARATGTLFVQRNRAQARAHTDLLKERLLARHKLLFFPEGTSTDGLKVLPFKTTLFQSFFTDELNDKTALQPVSIRYISPPNTDARFYGWWGDMDLGPHLLHVLAQRSQGRVCLHYHAPLRVADFPDRKSLARACEEAVRAGHEDLLKQNLF